MTRTSLALALGFGLLGTLAAQSATAAPPYSTSTRNADGSRTMCGPSGCTTVPASQLGGASWYGSTTSRSRFDRGYGYGDSSYRDYGYGSAYGSQYGSTSFDPYSWDSRSRTQPTRSGYGTSRSYDSRYGSGYDSGYAGSGYGGGYDGLGYGSGCQGAARGGYGARSTGYGSGLGQSGYGNRGNEGYRYGDRSTNYRTNDRWSMPY